MVAYSSWAGYDFRCPVRDWLFFMDCKFTQGMNMEAIIEKEETILVPKAGFVTGNEDKVIIIKVFSFPVYVKRVSHQVKS